MAPPVVSPYARCEAVCILKTKSLKPDWKEAKVMLGDVSFLTDLLSFDKDSCNDKQIKASQPSSHKSPPPHEPP